MRTALLLVSLFLLPGCTAPEREPTLLLPTMEEPVNGWRVFGPSFANATVSAQDSQGHVGVIGDRFWIWVPANNTTRAWDLPPLHAGESWAGIAHVDEGWAILSEDRQAELYSAPCATGCIIDAVRIWHESVRYILVGDSWVAGDRRVVDEANWTVGRAPTGTDMDEAWASQVQLDDVVYRAEFYQGAMPQVSWSNETEHGTLDPLPCRGNLARLAASNSRLYALVHPGWQCPGSEHHLFQWGPEGWRATQNPAPASIANRTLLLLGDLLVLPGDPTLAYEDDNLWWGFGRWGQGHPIPVRYEVQGYAIHAYTAPYEYPWGPATATWECSETWCPGEGWNVTLRRPMDGKISLHIHDPLFNLDYGSAVTFEV